MLLLLSLILSLLLGGFHLIHLALLCHKAGLCACASQAPPSTSCHALILQNNLILESGLPQAWPTIIRLQAQIGAERRNTMQQWTGQWYLRQLQGHLGGRTPWASIRGRPSPAPNLVVSLCGRREDTRTFSFGVVVDGLEQAARSPTCQAGSHATMGKLARLMPGQTIASLMCTEHVQSRQGLSGDSQCQEAWQQAFLRAVCAPCPCCQGACGAWEGGKAAGVPLLSRPQ